MFPVTREETISSENRHDETRDDFKKMGSDVKELKLWSQWERKAEIRNIS